MNSPETQRQKKLAQLGQDRPLVAGTLNRVERKDASGRTTVYHLLTFKEEGKTRSVYVPKDLVKEVQRWTRNHHRIKQLLSEISALSIDIIRRHVPRKRMSARGDGASRRVKPNSR